MEARNRIHQSLIHHKMKLSFISILFVFLLTGSVKSSESRQKRFILLKKIMQMGGSGGSSNIFLQDETPAPPVPSCPNIYIQHQSQPNSTPTAYNSPAYEYTPPPNVYTSTPPPSYALPSPSTYAYVPSTPSPPQSRYEQPSYLQMPPIYKQPPPPYVPEQSYNPPVQSSPSSYQSPLVQLHMF